MKTLKLLISAAALLFVFSCSKKSSDTPPPAAQVITINSINPSSGWTDTVVTITGTNFSTLASENIVKFKGIQATVQSATSTTIKAVAPAGAGTGPISVATSSLSAATGPIFTYKAPIPPIIVGGIAPYSGGYGTVVSIRGTNFSSVASENIVTFNGKPAVVQFASPTILIAKVPLGAGTGPVSVSTQLQSPATFSINFTYKLTLDTFFSATNAYWKNGVISSLPRIGTYALTSTIFTVGLDLYIGGCDAPGNRVPVYWKNGIETSLSTKSGQGQVTTSFVSGTDIYFAGYDGSAPVYWKNGMEIFLPYTSTGAIVNTMYIQGSDIYFGGNDGINAVYWKNGTRNVLPIMGGPGSTASVRTMGINGTDVYFAGIETSVAAYWKNGVEYLLQVPGLTSEINTMAFSGNDVYFAGRIGGNPAYWKNGTEYGLRTTNFAGGINAMAVNENDVYFVGSEAGIVIKPVFWVNGFENFLNPGQFIGNETSALYLIKE